MELKDVLNIPVDPRYPIEKKPLITKEMKARFIGEFYWMEQADYYDEDGNLIKHIAKRTIPWDVVKDIYQQMAMAAAKNI